jgi:hypothetical protein
MFTMEVGNWNASIVPWRACNGRKLHGVDIINKKVFTVD